MSEIDPTRTRLLRDEYARALTKISKNAMGRVMEIIRTETINEQLIDKLQTIVEYEMGTAAKPIIDRLTRLAYVRGTTYAERKLKATGIQFSIIRAAPLLQFSEVFMIAPNIAIVDPETLKILRNLNLALVKKLSDEVKGKLAAEIRQGLLRGEHPYRIAKRLKIIGEMSKYRAEMIARTETIRSFNTAAEVRYSQAGIKTMGWLSSRDERVCLQCEALDGVQFRVDSGHERPPRHPNCRCTIIPVL